MIQIDQNTRIDPTKVAWMTWDRRFYANTAPDSTLVIHMVDGSVHRVHHGFGTDAYMIEAKILGERRP